MIGNSWDDILSLEYNKDYYKEIEKKVNNEYNNKVIFPLKSRIFYALKCTDYKNVRVVILGQDPYHGLGEANGLSFSVNRGIKTPPSLRNIFKELYNDLGIVRTDTDLSDWANQGVLLLNAILTVEKDKPASHRNIGWEEFSDTIIKKLNERKEPIVFILWGNYARNKKKYITNKQHLIIESPHPSPFSANNGFFGSKPFSKTNIFLKENNFKEIEW